MSSFTSTALNAGFYFYESTVSRICLVCRGIPSWIWMKRWWKHSSSFIDLNYFRLGSLGIVHGLVRFLRVVAIDMVRWEWGYCGDSTVSNNFRRLSFRGNFQTPRKRIVSRCGLLLPLLQWLHCGSRQCETALLFHFNLVLNSKHF